MALYLETEVGMQVEIRDEVKAVFDSFGMTDLNAIIENEAVMMLLSKEAGYRAEYNKFKTKYDAEFYEFKEKVEASGKEDFEVEDDLMDWEFAVHALANIEKKKKALGV